MAQQGGCQSQTLFHAQGILTHFFVLLFFHAHCLQNLVDGTFRDLFQSADDLQIFPAAQMSVIGRGFYEGACILQD